MLRGVAPRLDLAWALVGDDPARMRAWLQDLDDSPSGHNLRMLLRDAGCFTSLVSQLETGGPAVAREAMLTLATLLAPSERLKQAFEASVGFASLAQLVGRSALAQPRPALDLGLLEAAFRMASLGPVDPGVVSLHFGAPPKLAPWILQCNAILNLRRPAPLFVARMQAASLHMSEVPGTMSATDMLAKSETASVSRRSEGSEGGGSRLSGRAGGMWRERERDPSVSSRTSDRCGRAKSVSSFSSDGVEVIPAVSPALWHSHTHTHIQA